MDELVVKNQSSETLTIQTEAIAAGDSFTVETADILDWAKDPYLRILCLSNKVMIFVYEAPLTYTNAADFLDKIAMGSVVFV